MFFTIKQFHKKHHTELLVIETIILVGLMTLFAFLTSETIYNNDVIEKSTFGFNFQNANIVNLVPVFLGTLQFVCIILIIILRKLKGNPIYAKKCSHGLFYLSIGCLVVDFILMIIFSNYMTTSGTLIKETSHRIGFIIQIVLQALLSFDIYVWRSDFGLEQYYG